MTLSYQEGNFTRVFVCVCVCAHTHDKVEKRLLLHLIQLKWIFKTVSDHGFNSCAFLLEFSFEKLLLNSLKFFLFFFKQGIIIQVMIGFCVGLFCFKFVKLKKYGTMFLSQKIELLSPRFTYLKNMQNKLDSNLY